MEMLNKAKERFGFRNVWTLDGRIYYLAEGSTKPQICRNWTEVACFELWKKSVAWIPFLCFYFLCSFFLGETIYVNNSSQVSLLFCFYTTVLRLSYFVLIWFLQKIYQLTIFFSWANFTILLILFMLLTLNVTW